MKGGCSCASVMGGGGRTVEEKAEKEQRVGAGEWRSEPQEGMGEGGGGVGEQQGEVDFWKGGGECASGIFFMERAHVEWRDTSTRQCVRRRGAGAYSGSGLGAETRVRVGAKHGRSKLRRSGRQCVTHWGRVCDAGV